MNFADIVAISVWPVAAICVVIYFRLRRDVDTNFAYSIIVSLFVFIPYVFLFHFIIPQSKIAYFDLYAAAILFGGYLLIAAVHAIRYNPQKATRVQLFLGLIVGVAFGICGAAWGTANIYGDYFQPRLVVEGRIQKLDVHYYRRPFKEYRVEIDGNTFHTIERDYKLLRVGENIRAEVGQGSHLIFSFTKLGN